MNVDLFGVTGFFVIVANVLWYYIKYLLRQNGYETHLFRSHFSDIVNLQHLMGNEDEPDKKRKYKIILIAFYSVIALAVGGFITLVYTSFMR